MALTLVQAALASQDNLQRGVIETFIQESPVLGAIPLLEIEGNAYAYNKEATLPGVEFRAVNAGYTESTGTIVQATESLVILGGDADVDTFLQRTRSNLNDQRAIQTRLKVKAAAYKYQDTFINGDTAVDANSFDGLKKRLTGAQSILAGTDGIPILGTTEAERHAFFDALDSLLAAVAGGAEWLFMNRATRSKITSAMRRLNMNVEPVGRIPDWMMDEAVTARGVQVTVPTYNGIPMFDIGQKADGTEIIPFSETAGSSNVTASIYAGRWSSGEDEAGVAGLTNGGVDVRDLGEVDDKPAYRTRIEFFCGLATFGTGAARLRGLLNS
jgi:hypothetical protein